MIMKWEVRQELAAQNPQEEERSDSEPDEHAEADGTEKAEISTHQSNADTLQKLKDAYETVKLVLPRYATWIPTKDPKSAM
jgi:hypothetical protein